MRNRTQLLTAAVLALVVFAVPAAAQTDEEISAAQSICSLQLLGVDATPEQIKALTEQAARIERVSKEFLATNSQADLVAVCPAQADLFASAFDVARQGVKASTWTSTDRLMATIQSGSLVAGFEAASQEAVPSFLLAGQAESCTAQCKRERDACIRADGCAPGYPCFCCVPCNVTWLACLADCCLP